LAPEYKKAADKASQEMVITYIDAALRFDKLAL
jgi:hypothetical protein